MADFGKRYFQTLVIFPISPQQKDEILDYFCLHQCSFKFKLRSVKCRKACVSVRNYICVVRIKREVEIPKWMILKEKGKIT